MTSPATRRAVATAIFCCTAALTAACSSVAGSAASGHHHHARLASSPGPAASSAARHKSSQGRHSTSPPSPTSPRASSGPGLAGCASSALKARVIATRGGAAAGSIFYAIDFTNTSGAACTMFGFPGVSFVTGRGGSMLGKPASRNQAAAPVPVKLAPGAVAHSTLQVADAGNYSRSQCKPVTGHWLKIYPPNQFKAIYTRFTAQVCSAKLPQQVGSQLSVFVVGHGSGKGGQGP